MRALVWFRSDLRTHDNTALREACRRAPDGIVAVFVIAPAQWRSHDVAPARVDLILRTLRELSADLATLNIPLLVPTARRAAEIPALLLDLARRCRCAQLHFNKEYEVDESRRDRAVCGAFAAADLAVFAHTDQVVLEPGEVRTGEGRFFTVFTPFKRAWIRRVQDNGDVRVLPPPKPQRPVGIPADPIPVTIDGFASKVPATRWPAGEDHARRGLSGFIRRRVGAYHDRRDFPALEGTSGLSAYLTIGALSPRQCLRTALDANSVTKNQSAFTDGNAGVATWISELIWREFYVHVLSGFPRVSMHRAFRPATERVRWLVSDEHLAAWQEGRTGVPIVDAGMRQLRAEGWMHNRLRMITAMYFSKNLLLDWRLGEKHFMRHLADGFLASNNGGWQWSASTGTDAAPYFRVFNPVTQSRRFDPAGEFIRTYVPELARLDDRSIHDPSPAQRGEYPAPLVDLKASRARAIRAFRNLGA